MILGISSTTDVVLFQTFNQRQPAPKGPRLTMYFAFQIITKLLRNVQRVLYYYLILWLVKSSFKNWGTLVHIVLTLCVTADKVALNDINTNRHQSLSQHGRDLCTWFELDWKMTCSVKTVRNLIVRSSSSRVSPVTLLLHVILIIVEMSVVYSL